jgi:alkyl hydroperoxide reductase subunit AhpF
MKVLVEEISSPGCHICKEFEAYWNTIKQDWPDVEYRNTSVVTPEGQELVQKHMIFASPGILVNGELFSTGGFNRDKFIAKLKEVSAK